MLTDEYSIRTADGIDLWLRRFRPASSTRRTLVIVHGTSEYGGRYQHVAQRCVAAGWNVLSGDLRGHGRSGGTPTHVDTFQQYLDDLDLVWRHEQLVPSQSAAMGHSFGGLIAIRFAQTQPDRLAALVLLSPLLRVAVPIPRWKLGFGKLMSLLVPRYRFRSTIDNRDTTRDAEVLARRESDPLIHRHLTAGWFFEMQAARRAAWSEADRLRVPLLALQAGADRIVDPDVVEPWINRVGSPDRSFRRFDAHLHELLNEPDWPETLQSVLGWLDQRIPREPAA